MKTWQGQSLAAIQSELLSMDVQQTTNGARVVSAFIESVDCVRYTQTGITFLPQGLVVVEPEPDEVLLAPTSVSLCGTDIDLIKKAKQGALPPESVGKVVGHEAAGFVVGVGSEVQGWQIGQYVCLDSHFSCGVGGHQHFSDCVHAGKGCDGIVGGIRGSLQADGLRQPPRDGYWSRVIRVPASALPIELPLSVAQTLVAPSTLESLGNIYMIIGQLKQVGLLDDPQKTVCVVSGLGATGYPMAAVAKHYGMPVIGVNPSAGKRAFATNAGVCDTAFAQTPDVLPSLEAQVRDGVVTQVVVAVMVGDPSALESALALLEAEGLRAAKRRACIVFGLYPDAKQPMPGKTTVAQRDFVFGRQTYTTSSGVEVYGVCGRDMMAWTTLLGDLQPQADGQPSALATMLNKAQFDVGGTDPLAHIALELQSGSDHVKELLDQHQALKLVANLVHDQK